ncbi:hypothetical protein AN237_02555 [Raoultella ornithinolytica]|nr:hypothetical protein AN237_02555 [Raoultella ornithinolytica]
MAVSSGYTHVGVTPQRDKHLLCQVADGMRRVQFPAARRFIVQKTIPPIADATPVLHHHEANIVRLRHQD